MSVNFVHPGDLNKPQGYVVAAADRDSYKYIIGDIQKGEARIAELGSQIVDAEHRFVKAEALLREKQAEVATLKAAFEELRQSIPSIVLGHLKRAFAGKGGAK